MERLLEIVLQATPPMAGMRGNCWLPKDEGTFVGYSAAILVARRSCQARLVRLKAPNTEIGKPASRNA